MQPNEMLCDSDEQLDAEKNLKHHDSTERFTVIADNSFGFNAANLGHVQRRLKQRHIQMIAIAGTIDTGLFLGSGRALSGAGPVGALIAYAFIGTVAYATMCAAGEMTCHAPISGTFPHFAARWVDPALGFAVGWNYFYSAAMLLPVEIMAAQLLIAYWDDKPSHAPIYIAVICILVCCINVFGVRFFGESEFVFSMIKIIMIIGLIITGLVIDLGGAPDHQSRGFQYWRNPGALVGAGLEPKHVGLDRFFGIVSVLVQAAYSFQGVEMVAVAASETESPRRNVAKTVRRVFYRIWIFYVFGIFITGLIVPSNDPNLLHPTGNAAQSPYVIAMTRAGIKVLPSIINAGVFTSAFSTANSALFVGSRILYKLALRGQAPKFLAYCTQSGLPLAAVLCSLIVFLSFMTVSSGGATVFNWFVNLSTVAGFITWASINLTFIRFYHGMRFQGFDRKKLAYSNPFQPYLAYWGVFWTVLLVLINGFEVFWHFTATGFLTSYINIAFFAILYFGWKITKGTKIWKLDEMDFVTGIPSIEETELPPDMPVTMWQKIASKVF